MFSERAMFVSCVDQKLSTLQEVMDSFQEEQRKESTIFTTKTRFFDGDFFASQSRFDAYAGQ